MIEYKGKQAIQWEPLVIHENQQVHDYDADCFHIRVNGIEYLNGWCKELQAALEQEKQWLILSGKWFNQKG
jgi:hypothetical protein